MVRHKDQVLGPGAERRVLEQLSERVVERFDMHPVFSDIVQFRELAGSGGGEDLGASLAFFPIDNTQSDGQGNCDPVLASLRGAVQSAQDGDHGGSGGCHCCSASGASEPGARAG